MTTRCDSGATLAGAAPQEERGRRDRSYSATGTRSEVNPPTRTPDELRALVKAALPDLLASLVEMRRQGRSAAA